MASRRPGRRSGRACCTGLAPGEEASLITLDRPADCPECGAAGSVSRDLCEICFADVGELSWPGGTADLSPAVPPPRAAFGGRPLLHPSIPLRFSDVIEELREIAALAGAAVEVEGSRLARACQRAESVLRILRVQFLDDVVADGARPARL